MTSPGWIAAGAAVAASVLVLIYFGVIAPAAGLLALFVLLGALFRAMRDEAPRILVVFLLCLLVMVVAGRPLPRLSESLEVTRLRESWVADTAPDRGLPAVIHIVLDEMMSTGAMTDDLPGASTTRQALYDLGQEYGLRTFDSVYSRAFFSGRSLPNLFNSEYLGRTALADRYADLRQTVRENAYFEAMGRRGYRTAVFQTTLLNFCANPQVSLCETFASYDASVVQRDLRDFRSRVVSLLDVLLRSYEGSYAARFGRALLGQSDRDDAAASVLGTAGRVDVQGFPRWFARFVEFVAALPRGTHVFAHVMVPHSPYMLQPDCSIGPDQGAGYYLNSRIDPSRREAIRRRYYADYFAQAGCVARSLRELLEAVRRNPDLHDATVIVHGDHGSRISAGNLIEDHSERDYVDNYGTYFAVRSPGVAPGVDCGFSSLMEVFRPSVGAIEPLTAMDRQTPPVIVQSSVPEGGRVEAQMPRFGCAVKAGEEGLR